MTYCYDTIKNAYNFKILSNFFLNFYEFHDFLTCASLLRKKELSSGTIKIFILKSFCKN